MAFKKQSNLIASYRFNRGNLNFHDWNVFPGMKRIQPTNTLLNKIVLSPWAMFVCFNISNVETNKHYPGLPPLVIIVSILDIIPRQQQTPEKCPGYVTLKLHLMVRLQFYLPLLPGSLWSGGIVPISVLSIGQIDLFENYPYSTGPFAKKKQIKPLT